VKSDALLLAVMLLMQWIIGLGAVGATGYRLERQTLLPLSLLLGMFLHSLSLFAAQLVGVPLSLQTMLVAGTVTMLLPLARYSTVRRTLAGLFDIPRIRPTLYDVVFTGFVGYVGYMIIWASWYWPVTPSNQPFYAPFAMLMQVMMKLIGYPYTQIWVSIVAICFWWFVWSALRRLVHPLFASVLLVLFVLTPEMLGYSYILQTDFANAAYFTIGCVMLARSIDEEEIGGVFVSALAFAGACWSRTETPLLVVLVGAVALPKMLRVFGPAKGLIGAVSVLAMSTFTFGLWNVVFFNSYLPVRPSTSEQIRGFDFERFTEVVASSWSSVIASTELWGWIVWLFLGVLVIDLIINRRISQPIIIGCIFATVFGLFVVGTIFSAAIVEQTLRRGMFKVIPLMVIAIAGSGIVSSASSALFSWEAGRKS
jgi:hypothetical protein